MNRKSMLREFLSLALLVVTIFAARSSLADHYYVPSGSMQHTLEIGDRVLVDKRAYGLRLPFTRVEMLDGAPVSRGEVVIFDSPLDGKRLIKRIVAVGGDEVRIEDGRLVVNGRRLAVDADHEAFGDRLAALRLDSGGGPDYARRIPEDMLLAVGDHRGNSLDGRVFGLVPETDVYARAIAVYWRSGRGPVWLPL